VVKLVQLANAFAERIDTVSGRVTVDTEDPANVFSGINVILVDALKSTVETFEFANAPGVNVVPRLAVTVVTAVPIDPAVIAEAGSRTIAVVYSEIGA